MTNGHSSPPPQPLRPWGHLSTVAWALLATLASIVTGGIALGLWFSDGAATTADLMKDARLIGWLSLAALLGELAALVAAAKLRGWSASDYLGLTRPRRSELVFGIAVIVAVIAVFDTSTWLLGRDVITPFQVEIYNNARATGSWLPLLLAVVIGAPVGEELMFRGFLFRGWAQTPRQVWPAIVIISAVWAAMHTQYDWYSIGQIFLLGIVLGWLRWASGSTLLTMLLHGTVNAWATVQTIVVMEFLR